MENIHCLSPRPAAKIQDVKNFEICFSPMLFDFRQRHLEGVLLCTLLVNRRQHIVRKA